MDTTLVITTLSNWFLIAFAFYFAYRMFTRTIEKRFENVVNQAIIRLDEKARVINALRNIGQ